MKTTEEMISVMRAYADGKTIQFKPNMANEWLDWTVDVDPLWEWTEIDYRVKPEAPKKKVVPYENAEEFLAAQKEHGPYFMINDDFYFPLVINSNGICIDDPILAMTGHVKYAYLTEPSCKWQDGSPIGKEVEV